MKKFILTSFGVITFLAGQTQEKNFLDQPYLEVSGSADTSVTPNEIFIKILITEKDSKDRVSVEELEIKMFNTLKNLGIDVEKNLTTSDIASNFRFYFLKSKDVLKSKLYILKVGEAVTATKVFIELENLGISNTSIDRVDHSDLENIKNMMRTNAIENAKARALAVTKPLNQNIGPAIHIADNENYNFNNQLQGRAAGILIRGTTSIQNDYKELPKIEFEKIKVAANINVKFMLK